MLFNSPTFILFFVCVFALYWRLRDRAWQNRLLLIASYIFYGAWSWKFLLLLLLTTVMDYACGLLIAQAPSAARKRLIMLASVSVNLSVLAIFKYFGFFVAETAAFLEGIGFRASLPVLEIVLPVGISFYTFQSIGYVVDVYRGKVQAARNLLEYALYVAFFPQLVAGPIERATHLLPQIQQARIWNRQAFEFGLQLMAWGLFKKVVIADNLAPYVDVVYSDTGSYAGTALVTATVFFAFQIYCDFSGYTDIARGTARTLGFELIKNFDYPYISRTPVEFWRRWHISLSQWFQDYLYFPLAMHYLRKGGWASKYKAHIVSMALIGFWHGANWTFIVFGLYWGIVIALYLYATESLADAPRGRLREAWTSCQSCRTVVPVLTMFAVACVGWVFFRADSLTSAWDVLSGVFSSEGLSTVRRPDVMGATVLYALIFGLLCFEWLYRQAPAFIERLQNDSVPALASRCALVIVVLFTYIAAQGGASQPFIYFQF
jgi:alginate O-acetyltransferase complex protein AlgI